MRNVLSSMGFGLVGLGASLGVLRPRGGVAVAAIVLMACGLGLFVVAWWEPPTVALLRRLLRSVVA